MLKFDAERKAKYNFEITFWLDFWDGPGGKGGGRIQNHFNIQISGRLLLGFDTRCTPGGVRPMKIHVQMEPQSHPKIAV